MPHRLGDLARERLALLALARVEAELHPVELGRARRRAGRASRRGGCRPRRRAGSGTARRCSFAAAISSAWRRSASASRPGTTRTFGVWSQIARYSWPSSRAASAISSTDALPSDHVVWQWRSPRMSASSTSARRLAAERRLAQLGRAPRDAERRVERLPRRGASGSGAERLDVRRRCRSRARARCRTAPARRRRARPERLRRDADRAALRALDHGDDLRQPLERVEHRLGLVGGDDDRELARRVDPAPRVAGDLAAERRGDLPTQRRAPRSSSEAAPRLRLARAASRRSSTLALGRRADPAHRRAAARERRRRGTRRPSARRAPPRSRASASARAR